MAPLALQIGLPGSQEIVIIFVMFLLMTIPPVLVIGVVYLAVRRLMDRSNDDRGDLEARIADLEARVATLERGSRPTNGDEGYDEDGERTEDGQET